MDLNNLINKVTETEDQTVDSGYADFERYVPDEGPSVARMITYVELGKHDGGEYEGKKKPDTDKVIIEFELLAPRHIQTVEKDDGTSFQYAPRVRVQTDLKTGEKANFRKLLNKVNAVTGGKHMAEGLKPQHTFLINVVHGKSADGKKTYLNMRQKGGDWLIGPAKVQDPETGEVRLLKVADALTPVKAFFYNHPTKETWDSLFIDGTFKKEDGTEISKNWLQELILSAKDYQGSALQAMLGGLDNLDVGGGKPEPKQEKKQEQKSSAEEDMSALFGGTDLDDDIPF